MSLDTRKAREGARNSARQVGVPASSAPRAGFARGLVIPEGVQQLRALRVVVVMRPPSTSFQDRGPRGHGVYHVELGDTVAVACMGHSLVPGEFTSEAWKSVQVEPHVGALGHVVEALKSPVAGFRGCQVALVVLDLVEESVACLVADLAAEVLLQARHGLLQHGSQSVVKGSLAWKVSIIRVQNFFMVFALSTDLGSKKFARKKC